VKSTLSQGFFVVAATLTIGEVARRAGIAPSALHYYKKAGILPAPVRAGGKRRYDADVIRRVDLLRFAQQAGVSLDEIKTLFYGFGAETALSARWRSLARKKVTELAELAENIRRMRAALELSLKCGCVRLEDCSLSPQDVSRAAQRQSPTRSGCGC
jgi:MerR family redox-sensitive transcriptional activator SoxR